MPSSLSRGKTKLTQKKHIKSIEELKQAINKGNHEFAILLNYGMKSIKHITIISQKLNQHKKEQKFEVFNEIDGSTQTIREKDIMDKRITNIGEAMQKKAFIISDKN